MNCRGSDTRKPQAVDSTIIGLWQRTAVVIRALVVGFVVTEIGIGGWLAIAALIPARWSLVVTGTGLWVFWCYFGGVVLHLNQAWAPPILLHIFAMSMMLGVLAYASGSLIPGIIGHTVMDVPNFAYWWTDVAGTFDKRPIAETGVDVHSIVWALIFLASVVLFCWAARQTLAARLQI